VLLRAAQILLNTTEDIEDERLVGKRANARSGMKTSQVLVVYGRNPLPRSLPVARV
jgi:hypothetical protein